MSDVSELVDILRDNAEVIAPVASKGFDSVLDEGRDLVDSLTDDDELKEEGQKALDILENGKQPFMRLTAEGFAYVLGHFGSDNEEAARNHYIATQATYAERRAWMQEGGDLAQKDREEREKAWADAKEVLQQVGTAGLKFLAKVALSTLGLGGLVG